MKQVSYESLLSIAIEKVKKEYGSIVAFSESEEVQKIGYVSDTGSKLKPAVVMSYMSMANGKKSGGKNFKFLQCLFAHWGIKIEKKKQMKVEVIITADL